MPILKGETLAETLRTELKTQVQTLSRAPHLAVLLVGEDPASALYVKLKKKAAEEIGIRVTVIPVEGTSTTAALVSQIERWNEDSSIDGILVQLPLPAFYDEQAVINAMDPKKDVDGFHPENLAALERGEASIIPPVHEGILRLIAQTPVHINGARAALLGNSDIFTKPLADLLTKAGCLVTRLGATDVAREEVKEAEIVISAVGSPHFIKPEHVKEEAVLIDVGTTKLENGTLAGDFDTKAFTETACWITPVPGGVGPMTIAQLLWNVYHVAQKNLSI